LQVKVPSKYATSRRSSLKSRVTKFDNRGAKVKKAIILSLSDEDLFELERIMLDNDSEGALKVLKKYLEREVKAAITGEGH
jgi:hypothetical protein